MYGNKTQSSESLLGGDRHILVYHHLDPFPPTPQLHPVSPHTPCDVRQCLPQTEARPSRQISTCKCSLQDWRPETRQQRKRQSRRPLCPGSFARGANFTCEDSPFPIRVRTLPLPHANFSDGPKCRRHAPFANELWKTLSEDKDKAVKERCGGFCDFFGGGLFLSSVLCILLGLCASLQFT